MCLGLKLEPEDLQRRKMIEFICKDPAIVKYCEKAFGPMLKGDIKVDKLHRLLVKEAKLQQWYDYVEIPGMVPGTTVRTPLMEDGEPVLLVPEIVVT